MNFTTWSARTGRSWRTPEIIFFTFSFNSFWVNISFFYPNIISFIVCFKNCYPKTVFIKTKVFAARNKFPSPRNNFFFIIITPSKITQHFKKCMVTRSSSNIFNIRIFSTCTSTFLTTCRSCWFIRAFFNA